MVVAVGGGSFFWGGGGGEGACLWRYMHLLTCGGECHLHQMMCISVKVLVAALCRLRARRARVVRRRRGTSRPGRQLFFCAWRASGRTSSQTPQTPLHLHLPPSAPGRLPFSSTRPSSSWPAPPSTTATRPWTTSPTSQTHTTCWQRWGCGCGCGAQGGAALRCERCVSGCSQSLGCVGEATHTRSPHACSALSSCAC